MEEDEFETAAEFLREMAKRHEDAVLSELANRSGEEPARVVSDEEAVLLGFDGNVESVWLVPPPWPDVLRRAIPHRVRLVAAGDDLDPLSFAEYRRVGQLTYQRVR